MNDKLDKILREVWYHGNRNDVPSDLDTVGGNLEEAKQALLKWRTDSLKEIVPEKEEEQPPTSTFEGTPIEIAARNYTWGFNRCVDQILNNIVEATNPKEELKQL